MPGEISNLPYPGKLISAVIPTIVGSVLVLRQNPKRKTALFVNDSITTMYLAKNLTAAVNTGIRLNPNGGSYEINSTNPYYGPISVACSVAAQNLLWQEEE
jgi:hypothetical protein